MCKINKYVARNVKKWPQKKLPRIQRGFVLLIARAHRTVSTDAARIVTGIEPLHLTCLFRARLINIKKGREYSDQIPTCEMAQKAHF